MSEPIFQAELNTEQGDQSQFDEEALLARRRTYVLGATAVGIVILAILAIPWRDYVKASGRVAPQRWARVRSEAPGVVREVKHTIGDVMEEGDVIAVLDFDSQRDAVEAARLALPRERQKLADLELGREKTPSSVKVPIPSRNRWENEQLMHMPSMARGSRRSIRWRIRCLRECAISRPGFVPSCLGIVATPGKLYSMARLYTSKYATPWRAIPRDLPQWRTSSPMSAASMPAGSSISSSTTCASHTLLPIIRWKRSS